MPCASAMALTRTGCGLPWLTANSSMATQAYSALADTRMVFLDSCFLIPGSDAASCLMLEDVQATLFLLAARPASCPVDFAFAYGSGTRPTADAWITLVVQRIVSHRV